jgi:ATP synthase subunit 6
MWLSLSLSLSIFIYGIRLQQIQFLKIFIPECPFLLLPMLILIEIFSYIIRAFSLAIRLSANIMAGHTLLFIVSVFILNLAKMKWWLFFVLFPLVFLILFLELGVAYLQAYVFLILFSIYIKDIFNKIE